MRISDWSSDVCSSDLGKSVFNAGEDVATLVQNAGGAPRVQQAGGHFERAVDAGRMIGIDRATGQPTPVYTVITNAANDLITGFPGRPQGENMGERKNEVRGKSE